MILRRSIPWGLCFLVAACVNGDGKLSVPVELSQEVRRGDSYQGVVWRGAVEIRGRSAAAVPIVGVSGLAWDDDEGILYAVSDYGWLHHLRPVFDDGHLRAVEWLGGFPLRGRDTLPLRGSYRDAEDLAIQNGRNGRVGDTTLLVSFELQPRVVVYDTTGNWLRSVELPAELATLDRYPTPNSGLEAIAQHPRHGLLMAPEYGLQGLEDHQTLVFASSGGRWVYPLGGRRGNGLTALEVLDDGTVLGLERAFVIALSPVVVSLRRFSLPASLDGPLEVRTVAEFDAGQGWITDNFEGLAHHRHGRVFMISDDNGSMLQSTYLVYLELRAPHR